MLLFDGELLNFAIPASNDSLSRQIEIPTRFFVPSSRRTKTFTSLGCAASALAKDFIRSLSSCSFPGCGSAVAILMNAIFPIFVR